MSKKTSSILLVLVPAVITFVIGPLIWKMAPGPVPTGFQMFLLILLSALESLTFGFGVLFIVRGYAMIQFYSENLVSKKLMVGTYFSIAWSLISWWPHGNFHRSIGMNLNSLIAVEYFFHLTLYVTAVVIAIFFLRITRELSGGGN